MLEHRVTAWLAGLSLVLVGASHATAAEAPIGATVAALFVGEQKIVEGTVTATERDASVVHLRFGAAPQAFQVSLVIGLLSDFPPDPERYYLNRSVRVVGTIRSFKDRPEMVIHDPANIRLVSAAIAPVAAATPGDDAAALREQVKILNERVRTLEGQVQKLKAPGGDE